jgi:hypothetical protein
VERVAREEVRGCKAELLAGSSFEARAIMKLRLVPQGSALRHASN